jgi:hypothetical protein
MGGICRSKYQEKRVGVPLIGFIPLHCCACLIPGSGFPTSYVVVFFMLNVLRWAVIVRFVKIFVEMLTITV